MQRALVLLSCVVLALGQHFNEHHEAPQHLPEHHEIVHEPAHHDPLAHSVSVHTVGDGNVNTVAVIKRTIDSPLEDIQWASDEVLFVLSEKGQVWRSQDSGKEWKSIMPKLQSESMEGAAVKSVYISTVDSNMIFLMGTSKVNWFSHDQGKTFHTCDVLDLHDVRMHPTQKTWMLGAVMSHGCTVHDSPDSFCYKELYVSKDLCAHWQKVDSYVVQFDWSPPIGPADHAGNRASDDLIYVTTHSNKAGQQRFGFWDKDINFVQSYDYFATPPQVLVPHGNRFLFGEHSFLFVAAVNPVHETEVHLMITRDNTTHKLFQRAILPVDLTQHSYTILDTSDGSVFLHVNHQPFSENAATGHVYISDWSGLLYSLSLPYNHRSSDGKCDFEKVEGLEGIYLANFIDEAAEGDKTIDVEESEEDPIHGSSHSDKPLSHHSHHSSFRAKKAKTVITFDKGGVWSYLDAPTHDSMGHPIHCNGACHLHLHGVTDTFGPFYSSKSATGVIMATGTVGSYLHADSEINTYLSRDAGMTWAEVRKGSHIYEFGDHGGLLVMADDTTLSHSVWYSWDSGHSWTELIISDFAFQIENIIIEPTATSQVFIVYGWHENSGVLVYLNFGELHLRECVGRDRPNMEDSDYEFWSPRNEPGGKCLMGHTVQYTRRKPFSACYNPDAFERVTAYTNCPCTPLDFECDYGYERKESVDENGNKVLNGPCEPMREPPLHQDPTAGKECVHTQRITRGYRRVPGDTCVGGVENYDAIEMPCPSFLSSGSFGKFFLILFVLIAVGLCATAVAAKYNLLQPCMIQLRKWGLGAGKGPTYAPVDGSGSHEPDDAQSYLNEEEFGRSAELLADGAVKKKPSKASSSSHSDAGLLDAAVIDDSSSSSSGPSAKNELKPLPPAKTSDVVPALAPPRMDDDFNPRKSN